MVKGISRQVIVVHSPDPKLFEQAIFIIKEDAKGVTDEMLLKEADKAIRGCGGGKRKRKPFHAGPIWACAGAMATGLVWLICTLL